MAKPLQINFPARDHEAELKARLEEGPIKHAEAIGDFLELIEVLHRKNLFLALRGVVGAGEDLVTQVAKASAQKESIRAMRNLLALSKILGQIDPKLIEEIGQSIPAEMKDPAARGNMRTPGLWEVVRKFWSRPARRTLFLLGLMLAGGNHVASRTSQKSR